MDAVLPGIEQFREDHPQQAKTCGETWPRRFVLADRMRRLANTGRPLGDQGFLKKLSASLGRQLIPKKPARKTKQRK